jgi:hypothetical protein
LNFSVRNVGVRRFIGHMSTTEFDREWRGLTDKALSEVKEWRLQHPKATFQEIETTLDGKLNALRAQLLSDVSNASVATEWHECAPEERPCCPECGKPLWMRGKKRRTLQTQGGQEVALEREYGACPACGTGLFPPG